MLWSFILLFRKQQVIESLIKCDVYDVLESDFIYRVSSNKEEGYLGTNRRKMMLTLSLEIEVW